MGRPWNYVVRLNGLPIQPSAVHRWAAVVVLLVLLHRLGLVSLVGFSDIIEASLSKTTKHRKTESQPLKVNI